MNRETAEAVRERSRGHCEGCGLGGTGLVLHHRQLRSGGGKDTMANLLVLHDACHRWAHGNPRAAMALGWIVSRYAVPLMVPVQLLRAGHSDAV